MSADKLGEGKNHSRGFQMLGYNVEEENYFRCLTPEIAQNEVLELIDMDEDNPEYQTYFPKGKK